MDRFGRVERENVLRIEGSEALDEADQVGSSDGFLQQNRCQLIAAKTIRFSDESQSSLRDRRRDILHRGRSRVDPAVSILAHKRPSASSDLAQELQHGGVIRALSLLTVRSIQSQTEQPLQPEAVEPEERRVAFQRRLENPQRGGARAEVGLAARLIAIEIDWRGAEEGAERLAGGGAVVVVPVRVGGEVGEIPLAERSDPILREFGEERAEIGGRTEVGMGNSGVNDVRIV